MQQAADFSGELESFQLDVVTEAIPIESKALKNNELVVADPSLLGVAFGSFSQAWLAEENLRYGLLTGTRGINLAAVAEHLGSRFGDPFEQGGKAAQQIEMPDKVWCFLTATRYISRAGDGFENVGVFRGHREHQALSKEIARERAL